MDLLALQKWEQATETLKNYYAHQLSSPTNNRFTYEHLINCDKNQVCAKLKEVLEAFPEGPTRTEAVDKLLDAHIAATKSRIRAWKEF